MKAVIVVDVDDDLDLSQIHANVELYSNDIENTFHKGYLLKQVRPLPQKYEYYDLNEQPEEILANYEARGWNACLEAITGETE